MKGEFLRAYAKIYLELEGLKFPEVLIESAYSKPRQVPQRYSSGCDEDNNEGCGKESGEIF
jgi:hypothetical protein